MRISLIFSIFAYTITRDNIQAELQVLRMENVRLINELDKRNEYARFLENENKAVEEETRKEYEAKLALMEKERDNALGKANEDESEAKNAKAKAEKKKMRADHAEQMPREIRKALVESNKRISVLSKQVKTLADLKEVADAADKTVLNAKQYVEGNEDEHTSVFLELMDASDYGDVEGKT